MGTLQQAGVTLIVIAVLSVLIASVVGQLWPILIVGAILVGIYKLMAGGRRL